MLIGPCATSTHPGSQRTMSSNGPALGLSINIRLDPKLYNSDNLVREIKPLTLSKIACEPLPKWTRQLLKELYASGMSCIHKIISSHSTITRGLILPPQENKFSPHVNEPFAGPK